MSAKCECGYQSRVILEGTHSGYAVTVTIEVVCPGHEWREHPSRAAMTDRLAMEWAESLKPVIAPLMDPVP